MRRKKVRTGLDVHGDDGLCDRLGLGRLLGGVGGDALSLEGLGGSVLLLVVGREEVELVVVVSSDGLGLGDGNGLDGGGRGRGSVGREGLAGVAGERLVLGLVRLNVRVPAGGVGVGRGGGRGRERLEDGDVSLRGGVAGANRVSSLCGRARRAALGAWKAVDQRAWK